MVQSLFHFFSWCKMHSTCIMQDFQQRIVPVTVIAASATHFNAACASFGPKWFKHLLTGQWHPQSKWSSREFCENAHECRGIYASVDLKKNVLIFSSCSARTWYTQLFMQVLLACSNFENIGPICDVEVSFSKRNDHPPVRGAILGDLYDHLRNLEEI